MRARGKGVTQAMKDAAGRRGWFLPAAVLPFLLMLAAQPGCWQEETSCPSIKIGAVLPLSGDRSFYGRDAMNGILAAVEMINRSGGVGGRKIDLIVLDNESRPDVTMQAIAKLDAGGVLAILGPLASRNALGASRAVQERGIPLVLPAATLTGVTRAGEYVCRVCFTNGFQARVAAHFAREFLRARSFAILTESGSYYSTELAEFFVDAVTGAGGEIVWRAQYHQGQEDFAEILVSLEATSADAVFLPGYYGEIRTFLQQARQRGLEIPVLGGDGWDVPAVAVSCEGGLPGHYFVAHFAADEPVEAVSEFVAFFMTKYGYRPHSLAALGYDAMSLVADALGRASVDTREDLKNAINSTRGFRGLTGTLSLDARRDGVKSAVILKTSVKGLEFIKRIDPRSVAGSDSVALEVPTLL
ncbi:MAG: ABC transporter substrate-binding protein [Candidatus Eisenbacteria sp.]|nr:ABC transporter substrate-binding protein [Candidatus Eisenbacteria bacterium]